jgi:hypothetical protein
MRLAKKVSIALSVLFAASASVFATTPIQINPDGGGPDSTQTVGSLGWNNGFSIAVNTIVGGGFVAPGAPLTTFGQGALANFTNQAGNSIGGLGLNSTYEWTYVFGLPEVVVSSTGTSATFASTGGGFFEIFYDASRDSSVLNGTGFTDGQLILAGTFLPFDPTTGVGASGFSTTGLGGALDQFGENNYANVTSLAGFGSFNLLAAITFADTAFFPSAPTLVSVTANGFSNLPFLQQNPSSCYTATPGLNAPVTDAVGPNTGTGATSPCTINTVGAVNGISGPNVAFETRTTSAFNTRAIPEPASLALIGIGLAALGGFGRRRNESR